MPNPTARLAAVRQTRGVSVDLTRLRRHPDVEPPSLRAYDAADALLLDEAAPVLRAAAPDLADVVVIGDTHGALTLSLVAALDGAGGRPARLRTHTDSVVGELALAANAATLGIDLDGVTAPDPYDDPAGLLGGARVVLLRLPRSLAALEETAQLVATHADPGVHLLAAGRDKHMTPAMNTILARSFADVRASRGRQKSRVLHARDARPGPLTHPVAATLAGVAVAGAAGHDVAVVAHGAAFAGAALDGGTRALLAHLQRMAPEAREAIDLGCGTGVLAVSLALARPDLRVLATDASAAAVASARATARGSGVEDRVDVRRADGLAGLPPASADLVVCNPPFHAGAAVVPDAGVRLLRGVRHVLRPGGELWTVYNSRLSRARELRRAVGPTEVVSDDGRFTVARTVRPD